MLKSRARSEDTAPKAPRTRGDSFLVALALALLLAAIGVLGSGLTALFATMWAFWVALPAGFAAAVVLVGINLYSHGTDVMDVIVSSVIVLVLCGILFPLFAKARREAEQKRKAQTHHLISGRQITEWRDADVTEGRE